ncbi:hypothetical protein ANTRET_LOCUS3855 [Anthophora retusa]
MSRSAWNLVLPISTLVTNATVGNRVTYGSLIENTMTIVRSCTMLDHDDALLLAGEYEEFFHFSLIDEIPVALISQSKSTAFEHFIKSRYSFNVFKQFSFLHLLWKLHQFVIVASSQPMLRLIFQKIKDSPWANFNGFHILIDRKTEEHGCINAYRFLWTAWEYDRLSTIFLCIDPEEGLLLYTYNPYSNVAPSIWQDAGQFKGRSGHPWILLKRNYLDGPNVCEDLMFDQTSNLDGYEIRINAISFAPHLRIDPTKSGWDRFSGDNSEIMKIVFDKLNASLNVRVHNGTVYDLGGIDSHGNIVGMLADVANGEVDMGMNVRSLYAMWKVEHTYPHGHDGLCVITQQAGEISEFIKIMYFMSPTVMMGNVVIFVITLTILTKYQGFLPAILNIIRLITTVSLRRLPTDNPRRIFFINVFIWLLIVNALFQSHWASLLTVPVSRPNIRTSEDLKNSNYKIYGSMYHSQELQDHQLRQRFHEDTYEGCKHHVLQSREAACLGDCLHFYEEMKPEHLHRSRRIQQNVQVYVTRENWPLFTRVSDLIRNTVQTGFVSMWNKLNRRTLYRVWKKRRIELTKKFRTMKLKHISFSFYILASGYSCATIVFLAEILLRRQQFRRSST